MGAACRAYESVDVPKQVSHYINVLIFISVGSSISQLIHPPLPASPLFHLPPSPSWQVPELEDGFSVRPNLDHVLSKLRRGQALLGQAAAVPILLGVCERVNALHP